MTYYGQWETDRIIESYFNMKIPGTFVEVGAYDGIKGSNSKYFEDRGWTGICIEPNPFIFPVLQKNRPNARNVMAACYNGMSYKPYHEFKVITMKSGIQSSLSALKTDSRLIEDYGDDIAKEEIVSVLGLSLNTILDTKHKYCDFISIDTEGTELDVLQGLHLQDNRPKLIIVENNYEDEEIRKYMEAHNYSFDLRYYVNDFFIRNRP